MMYIGRISLQEHDMHKRIPAYMKVYAKLKEKILDDTYPIGALMPTEPDLCAMFKVSRTTVRKAMELLEREGFVKIQQGRGTEILDYKATQRLNYVTSFTETLKAKGYKVQSKSTHIEMVVPPKNVLDDLNLPDGTEVVRIQRLKLANEKPLALLTNYIVADLVPGILSDTERFDSLYDYLESKYNIVISSARDTIKAKVSDFLESELLQIPIGSPLLVDRRITFSLNKPIEVVIMVVEASKYEFSVHLSGRAP
jgi:GntR family transcriptional regulator